MPEEATTAANETATPIVADKGPAGETVIQTAADTSDTLPEPWQREICMPRRENAEARNALQAHEDANRSDVERTKAERDRLTAALAGREQQLRAISARYEVARAAAQLGADAEVLYRYVRDDLKYDDEFGGDHQSRSGARGGAAPCSRQRILQFVLRFEPCGRFYPDTPSLAHSGQSTLLTRLVLRNLSNGPVLHRLHVNLFLRRPVRKSGVHLAFPLTTACRNSPADRALLACAAI